MAALGELAMDAPHKMRISIIPAGDQGMSEIGEPHQCATFNLSVGWCLGDTDQ
jgi:hypothetical protein